MPPTVCAAPPEPPGSEPRSASLPPLLSGAAAAAVSSSSSRSCLPPFALHHRRPSARRRQVNLLPAPVRRLHHQLPALPVQRDPRLAHTPGQIHTLPRRPVPRHVQRVRLHPLLQGLQHLLR